MRLDEPMPGSTERSPTALAEPVPALFSAKDRQVCDELLPEVSRTFALSIAALPAPLHDAVLAAYLLCRLVDTIEDEPAATLSLVERDTLFDLLAMTLNDPRRDPTLFAQACDEARLAGETADGRLCRQAGAVFRLFRALPGEQQRLIRPRVLVMLEGMRSYCHRADADGGLRMYDLADVERYCYYVAGTVGRLLTDLFLGTTPRLPANARRTVHDLAVSFGVGLQLVNMVKDVAEDLGRGTCFLPLDLATAAGVPINELLSPAHRAAGLALLRAVCARARQHLEKATTYTLTWPLPDGLPVRLFCLVPLALALATLTEVEAGHAALRLDTAPKIERRVVTEILNQAQAAAGDDDLLRQLLRQARSSRSP